MINFLYGTAIVFLIISGLDFFHHGICAYNVSMVLIGVILMVIFVLNKYKIK